MFSRANRILIGPQLLAFVPAMALGAYWIGGESVLIIVTLCAPLLLVITRLTHAAPQEIPAGTATPGTGHLSRTGLLEHIGQCLTRAQAANLSTGIYLIDIENQVKSATGNNTSGANLLHKQAFDRIRDLCRRDDEVHQISATRIAVLLAPCLKLDLDTMMRQANCIQTTLEDPATFGDDTHRMTASIGFCPNARIPFCTAEKLLDAAEAALGKANSHGPSSIRAWAPDMESAQHMRQSLLDQLKIALENGEIRPWFQPQICTSTGKVTGVEALARWVHPERGIVPPSEFLTAMEQAGLLDRLSETIFHQSLAALQDWDRAGIHVPRVSVNFSGSELRNPHLVDRLKWELDRFDMPATRLGVEILETVIADCPKGITVHNIAQLGRLGCLIDLDDFGTGHASITTLRRFTVHRLKIDRSFVTRIDRDEDQRQMFAAVLGLANRLGLETLAEGVETGGEHALLAQLGCDHVQGFGIARPMPAANILDWVRKHEEQVAAALWQGRNLG